MGPHVATVLSSSRSDSRAAWHPDNPSSSFAASTLPSLGSTPLPPDPARRPGLFVVFDLGKKVKRWKLLHPSPDERARELSG
eukprot:1115322-Rhodomonas_salina.1